MASNKSDYQLMKKKIESEYREKLKALEILFPEFSIQEKAEKAKNNDAPSSQRGELSKLIKRAIDAHPAEQFDLQTVRKWILEIDPQMHTSGSSISGKLIRLEKKGYIVIVDEGGGSSPKIYKKKGGD